MTDSVRSSKNS